LARGVQLTELCKSCGIEGIFPPWASDVPSGKDRQAAFNLFLLNVKLLHTCDLLIADISPFRGPHADDGTAFEIGMAFALNKPIFAYSSDLRPLRSRIEGSLTAQGVYRDKNGLEIEDFGQSHNLMLIGAVKALCQTAEEAISAAARFFALNSRS
jgi:nucleoside 2-deoxyribosyltransferase